MTRSPVAAGPEPPRLALPDGERRWPRGPQQSPRPKKKAAPGVAARPGPAPKGCNSLPAGKGDA